MHMISISWKSLDLYQQSTLHALWKAWLMTGIEAGAWIGPQTPRNRQHSTNTPTNSTHLQQTTIAFTNGSHTAMDRRLQQARQSLWPLRAVRSHTLNVANKAGHATHGITIHAITDAAAR